MTAEQKITVCGPGEIRLDREGRWFHEGVEITHQRTIELFNRSIKKDPAGGYLLQVGYEVCHVQVEDAPYLVRRAVIDSDAAELLLSDGTRERLDPATLRVGPDNVLYCTVRREFPARFLRPAYYQLMRALEETDTGYAVRLGDRLWPLVDEQGLSSDSGK